MAVFKTRSRMQIDRDNGVKVLAPVKRVDVKLSDDEKIAREYMVTFATVKVLPTVGKPLKCQKWYQPDYRSATPKGLAIPKPGKPAGLKRWSHV